MLAGQCGICLGQVPLPDIEEYPPEVWNQTGMLTEEKQMDEYAEKVCVKCHTSKPLEAFKRGHGRGFRQDMCLECAGKLKEATLKGYGKGNKKGGASPQPAAVAFNLVAADEVASVKELVDAHWKYISGVLSVHGEDPRTLKKIEYHYRTAALHFYKHGVEAEAERRDNVSQ